MGGQIECRANPIKLLGKSYVCSRCSCIHRSENRGSSYSRREMIIYTQLRLATMEASERRDHSQNYREDTISMKNRVDTVVDHMR
jgi:hypothetical protein